MKKQLLAILSIIAIANGINAMEESPEREITSLIASVKHKYPTHSNEQISQILLKYLLLYGSIQALELLLKEGINDETGALLEQSIQNNLYSKTKLLLQYGSPITDSAWKIAKQLSTRIEFPDDRILRLLFEEEQRREQEQLQEEKMDIERQRLPKQTELEKILQQLPLMKRQ